MIDSVRKVVMTEQHFLQFSVYHSVLELDVDNRSGRECITRTYCNIMKTGTGTYHARNRKQGAFPTEVSFQSEITVLA